MHHISPTALTTSLPTRITYLQSFLSFSPDTSGPLIHACAPILTPLIPTILDAVYTHLLSYSTTASAFLPAQHPSHTSLTSLTDLTLDSPAIQHRKDFLRGYLVKLLRNTDWEPDSPFWVYLDSVGRAHTGRKWEEGDGLRHRKGRPPLWVDYRDVNLLLGWVENAIMDIVFKEESLGYETKVEVVKALGKFWWIQNDLFARHYVLEGSRDGGDGEGEREEQQEERVEAEPGKEGGGVGGGVWGMLGWGR